MTAGGNAGTGFKVTVTGCGDFQCPGGQAILVAMEGARERLIPVGCRGGGCGVCRIRIDAGAYRIGRISSVHVDAAGRQHGVSLACRTFPESDLEISVLGGRRALGTFRV